MKKIVLTLAAAAALVLAPTAAANAAPSPAASACNSWTLAPGGKGYVNTGVWGGCGTTGTPKITPAPAPKPVLKAPAKPVLKAAPSIPVKKSK